ncbi:MAG: cell division protein FtsX [Solirubrobacterales bacterium]
MSRLFFFIAEAFRALRRSAAPSLAAIVTVVLTTLLLGVFVPVIKASSTTNNNVRSQLALRVFLKAGVSNKQGKNVQGKIDKIPHVARTQYISSGQGIRVLQNEVGKGPLSQGLSQLKHNPLPPSINVYPDDPDNLASIQSAILPTGSNKAKPISPAIDTVNNSQQLAHQIRTVTNAVKIILSVIAVLLLVASLMLVANTIRLSIYARRREVEVMRLVGATNWFIRWPFVIEGLIVGLAGAGVAVGLLWVGKVAIIDPLKQNFVLIDNFSTVGFTQLIVVLVGSAVVVSALGSGITLRRFLRV